VAEPAVVRAGVLVVARDPWAVRVATMISATVGPAAVVLDPAACEAMLLQGAAAPGLAVIVLGEPWPAGEGAPVPAAIVSVRSSLEARRVTHLTVARDERCVWVGPTVLDQQPGCASCWEARRRQHAAALAAAHGCAGSGAEDLARLAARAGPAVMRLALRSPEAEAAVVRRFIAGGAAPTAGRVVAVAGCRRCDPGAVRPGGRSPSWRSPARTRSIDPRKEVKYEHVPCRSR